jgi:hypothetical protein
LSRKNAGLKAYQITHPISKSLPILTLDSLLYPQTYSPVPQPGYFQQIRKLVSEDRLSEALLLLRQLLNKSKELDIAILQTGRFAALETQIMSGTISKESSTLERNKLRSNLLSLVNQLEKRQSSDSSLKKAITATEAAYQKNVLNNSSITAGGDVRIGDVHNQESQSSKWLKIFTYILIPFLAMGGAYLAILYFQNSQPINLKVRIENLTPSQYLPDPKGTIKLTFGACANTVVLDNEKGEVLFEGQPRSCFDEPLRLQYAALGFYPIDTLITWEDRAIDLPVKRNNDLALISGTVTDDSGAPVSSTEVSIQNCCFTVTGSKGYYELKVPFANQRSNQELIFNHETYGRHTVRSPVFPGSSIPHMFSKE